MPTSRQLLYDTGAVPLGVRLAVLPFLVGVGFALRAALVDPKLAPGPRALAVVICLALGWAFGGIWRFRTQLWREPDQGQVTWEWQGLIRRRTDSIDGRGLARIRVEVGAADPRGRAGGRVDLVRVDGRRWFTVPCGPYEAHDRAAVLAEALGLPVE